MATEPYTLAQATKDQTENLYVINKGIVRNGVTQKGNVLLEIIEDNRSDVIAIPNTWIPINLSDRIPKDVLLKSRNLRKLLSQRILQLVSPEDAEAILDDQDARAEQQNIESQIAAEASRTPEPSRGMTDDAKVGIHPLAISACERTDVPEQNRIGIVRNNASEFKSADWHYLLENGNSDRIKELAAEALGKPVRNQPSKATNKPSAAISTSR